jgi:hypothetical protein
MNIEIHQQGGSKIAEVTAEGILINDAEDGLQLLADLYYQDTDKIILHEKNIISDFFDLKSGLAGELLQKFSNYKVYLVIVEAFDAYPGKSLKDFIYESNKGRQVNFVASVEEALKRLSDN